MFNDANINIRKSMYTAMMRVLMPFIRILLRNGVTYNVFADISKQAFVRVADKELAIPGKKQTVTRIATLTGLPRKEVGKICSNRKDFDIYSVAKHNRAYRVISTWAQDPLYKNKRGGPVSLPFDGEQLSFCSLVKKSGVDIPPNPIYDELIHSCAIKKLKDGKLALRSRSYVPEKNEAEIISFLGTDVGDMIRSIDHNISCEQGDAFFQRKALFNDIPEEELKKLKKRLFKIAEETILDFASEIEKSDREGKPELTGTGRKVVGMSMFYFDRNYDESDEFDVL